MLQERKTETRRIWLGPEGILRVQYEKGAQDTMATAREAAALEQELAGGSMIPLLVDIRLVHAISREARVQFAMSARRHGKATAIIADSAFTRQIAEFVMKLDFSNVPIRLFTEEEEAIEWLKQYL